LSEGHGLGKERLRGWLWGRARGLVEEQELRGRRPDGAWVKLSKMQLNDFLANYSYTC